MVTVIPALADNYIYAIEARGGVIIVDPSEGDPVVAFCQRRQVTPIAIWCTHHHGDHTDGVRHLLDVYGPLPVVGSAYDRERERIRCQTHVAKGSVTAGGVSAEVIDVPGHTLGAVAYRVGNALFSGDTLFIGGCGRLFEGTPAEMLASLGKLRALPDETQLYCGHEYALKNLAFTRTLTPNDAAISDYEAEVRTRRELGEPSVPGTFGTEKRLNPMLRWDDEDIVRAVSGTSDLDTFTKVRALRDVF
ncbi:MAG: hydroxyacylglutathione hydrolase [Deltaproteobacteria bacterium]|nr:hydroxyacylglutathione hydrolase [Deltaproteobacteria bacterium]